MLLFDVGDKPITPGRAHYSRRFDALEAARVGTLPPWLSLRTAGTDAGSSVMALYGLDTAVSSRHPGAQITTAAATGDTCTLVGPQVDTTHEGLQALRLRVLLSGGATTTREFSLGFRSHLDGTAPTAGVEIWNPGGAVDSPTSPAANGTLRGFNQADGMVTAASRYNIRYAEPTHHDITLWWTPGDGMVYLGAGDTIDTEWESDAGVGIVTPFVRTRSLSAVAKHFTVCCFDLDAWYA